MKKDVLKKSVAFLMMAVMIFSLVACNGNTTVEVEDYRDFVFREETKFTIEKPTPESFSNEVFTSGENIFVVFVEHIYPEEIYEDYEEDYEEEYEEGVLDGTEFDDMEPKGTMAASSEAPEAEEEPVTEETTEVTEETLTEDGLSEETTEAPVEEILPYDGFYEEEYYSSYTLNVYIQKYDLRGTKISENMITLPEGRDLSRIYVDDVTGNTYIVSNVYGAQWYIQMYSADCVLQEETEIVTDAEWVYVNTIMTTDNGFVLLGLENEVKIYNDTLSSMKTIPMETYIAGMIRTTEGKCYVITEETGPDDVYMQVAKEIDVTQATLGEVYELPQQLWFNGGYCGCGSYDLISSDGAGLYGYSLSTGEVTKIMGYVESDLYMDYMNSCFLMDEETAIGTMYDENTWEMNEIVVYKKADPATLAEKEIISLGMVYFDQDVARMVIEYNKNNQDTRIQIKSYMEGMDDWEAAQTAFNNDLITGNCPDIVLLSGGSQDMYNYMRKGSFAQLDEFLASDAQLDAADLFPNVKEALSYDGKLYGITPGFGITTLAMKAAYAPAEGRISYQDLMQLEQQLGTKAFYMQSKSDLFYMQMNLGQADYIDVRNGKCEFGQNFVDALNYMQQYPDEIDYESPDYYSDYTSIYRNDQAILTYMYLDNFRSFNRAENEQFGEEIALVGFPGTGEGGSVIELHSVLAISAKSKQKEAAWQFVRQFLDAEFQLANEYAFPSRLSVCEQKMQNEMKRPFYTDIDGTQIEYDESYWMGDKEVVYQPISQERAQYLMDYIQTITDVYYYNDRIFAIIEEETAPVWAGQKTPEQAVQVIQSRVQTYIDENR